MYSGGDKCLCPEKSTDRRMQTGDEFHVRLSTELRRKIRIPTIQPRWSRGGFTKSLPLVAEGEVGR